MSICPATDPLSVRIFPNFSLILSLDKLCLLCFTITLHGNVLKIFVFQFQSTPSWVRIFLPPKFSAPQIFLNKFNAFSTPQIFLIFFLVYDGNGTPVQSQIYANQDVEGTFTLVFPVNLPALGFETYFISPVQTFVAVTLPEMIKNPEADIVMENEYLQVTISAATGRIASVTNKENGLQFEVEQDFLWWNASAGNNAGNHSNALPLILLDAQPSGAYIFRPNGTVPFAVTNSTPSITFNNGKSFLVTRYQYLNRKPCSRSLPNLE
jgi:hypothetical protein